MAGKSGRWTDTLIRCYSDAASFLIENFEEWGRALSYLPKWTSAILLRIGDSEGALEVYDQMVAMLDGAPGRPLRESMAKALFNKALTLGDLNRPADAIAAYDEVVRRLADAREPAVRKQVAMALVNKAATYAQLNRPEDAIVVHHDIPKRFASAREPAIREQVARALVNKAITYGQLNRSEHAIVVSDDILRRFADAPNWPSESRSPEPSSTRASPTVR